MTDKELLDLINEEEKEFLGNQVCVFCPVEIYDYWKSFLNKNMQVAIRNILRFKFLLNENFDI